MNVRPLRKDDMEAVGRILFEVFGRLAEMRGFPPQWASIHEAAEQVRACSTVDGYAVVAEEDGVLSGAGFMRRRGEIATIGPLVAADQGRGTGTTLLEELIQRADYWGCVSARLYQDAWNPSSFAFHAGRSFAVVDVAARIERPAGPAPKIDSARGLEITPFQPADLEEMVLLDLRLTSLERTSDLQTGTRLVARRKGKVVGFLGANGGVLGPALAIDVADLGGLVARALGEITGVASARLSTAAPLSLPAVLALGFRVVELGVVMSRGLTPPARPPQLYSVIPEIL